MTRFHLHLVSDSTGETVHSVARACLVQFDGAQPVEHVWSMVRTRGHIDRVIAGVEAHRGVVLFTVLAVMIRMGALKRPGLILGSFIAIYGIARIISEFFREPDPQLGFLWGGLTMGMLLSIPMIIAGAVVIVAAYRRKAAEPAAPPV